MDKMMKAYVFESANNAAIRDVPIPSISDSEVLIKVKAIGICHTDLMVLSGVNIVPVPFPFIGGHEWAGEIVEVGQNVKTFLPGDRVVGEVNSGCGSCLVCQEGHEDYCVVAPVQRGINCDGSMAEYCKTIPRLLHKIPDEMDWLSASLIEPFSVAYNGILGIGACDSSDTVVIQGAGSIGLCATAIAKAMGARVIVSEPQEYRRNFAKKMNADITIDPLDQNAVDIVKELTNGYGADLVVEASGNAYGMKQSLEFVRNNGRVSYIGVSVGKEIPVEIGRIQMSGIRVQGFLGSPKIWDRALNFIKQSKIQLSILSTHQYQLIDADAAFAFAQNVEENNMIKTTLLTE